MSHDEIKLVITEAVDAAVPGAVEKYVNGHIRDLRRDLEPVIEAVRFLHTLRRFLQWLGVPLAAIGIGIVWVLKKLNI